MKERHKEIFKSTMAGVGVGVATSTVLRLPLIGIFIDHECPERGASAVTAGAGIIGGAIGAGLEIRNQKNKK